MCKKEPIDPNGEKEELHKQQPEESEQGHESEEIVDESDRGPEKGSEGTELLLEQLKQELERLVGSCEGQAEQIRLAIQTAASCQRATAEVLNRNFERHALNPAVLSVGALAEELLRINQIAQEVKGKISGCPALEPLIEAATIGSQLAQDRLAYLDIEKICPEQGEELDPARHETTSVEDTENPGLHRKVAQLVSPGLIYRGEVLRPAKVSVFRFTGQAQTAQQKEDTDHDQQ